MASITLAAGYWFWNLGRAEWQTMLFTTLTFSQIFLALALRSRRDSLFQIGLFSSRPLLGTVALSFVLQLLVVYNPICQSVFDTVALPREVLAASVGLALLVFFGVELEKLVRRVRGAKAPPDSAQTVPNS